MHFQITGNNLDIRDDVYSDAGPILCAVCHLQKWCLGSLVAICTIEVSTGYERDIYCAPAEANEIQN